jgi:hypothetical protein
MTTAAGERRKRKIIGYSDKTYGCWTIPNIALKTRRTKISVLQSSDFGVQYLSFLQERVLLGEDVDQAMAGTNLRLAVSR